MKFTYIIFVLGFIGCFSNKSEDQIKYENVDSIINQSNISIIASDSVNKESERLVSKKVDNTVNRIEGLKEEVTTLKREIETVKLQKVIYKVDTVYIETKKNFWGKEKTNTIIKSDSSVSIDSLQNN